MGTAAPTVGAEIFSNITVSKNVTVRVPSSATGYDDAWKTAFKGLGNDGINYSVTPAVNTYINLQIVSF
jgi:hypothetical protein